MVKVWHLESRRVTTEIRPHTHVLNVAWKDENTFLTQGREGCLKVWDLNKIDLPVREIQYLEGSQHSFCKFSYLKTIEHDIIASIDESNDKIKLYHLNDKNTSDLIVGGEKYGMIMCFHLYLVHSVVHLAVGFESGVVSIWNLAKQAKTNEFQISHEPIMCINELDGVLIVGSAANSVFTVKEEKITPISIPEPGIADISCHGRLFATGGWDHKARIFDIKKNKLLCILKTHTASVNSVDYRNEDGLLATGSKDTRIAIWNPKFKVVEKKTLHDPTQSFKSIEHQPIESTIH